MKTLSVTIGCSISILDGVSGGRVNRRNRRRRAGRRSSRGYHSNCSQRQHDHQRRGDHLHRRHRYYHDAVANFYDSCAFTWPGDTIPTERLVVEKGHRERILLLLKNIGGFVLFLFDKSAERFLCGGSVLQTAAERIHHTATLF